MGESVAEPRAELLRVVDLVPYTLYHCKGKRAPRIRTGTEVLQEGRDKHALPAIALVYFLREVCHGAFDLRKPIDVDGL